MHPIITAIGLLTQVAGSAHPQQGVQEPTVARQKVIPADEVLSGRIKITKDEKDALKEQIRHNRVIEKELRKMRKDDRFTLGRAKPQPKRVRTFPAHSNRY